MDLSERDYYLGFSVFPDIGPKRFKLLTDYFGSAKNTWEATEAQLLSTNLPGKIAVNFLRFREIYSLEEFIHNLARKKIEFVTIKDANYPKFLKEISDPPFVLYLRGNSKLLIENKNKIGIVGTRMMTVYGKKVTENIVKELTLKKICIISGLAMGIDTIAHQTTLDNGGKTIAVLGSGIDFIYPPANYDLYLRIIREGSLIISEYPPGFKPSKTSFPQRNRIVAGLSKAIVVVEGKRTSGSMITAKYALEYGREVFAVPGPVDSPMSQATSYLLKNGAAVATDARDILELI